LPVAVSLKRFFVPEWDFIFGMGSREVCQTGRGRTGGRVGWCVVMSGAVPLEGGAGKAWRGAAIMASVLGGAVACALWIGSGTAQAASTTVVCNNDTGTPNLQTTLSGAASGDTIIIDGICVGHFSLPAATPLTLEGQSGTTSGISGNGSGQLGSLLGGTIDEPSATTTIENLTFENAVTPASADPSAFNLEVDQGALVLSNDTFTNNSDSDTEQPPVFIGDACVGTGGSISIAHSTFTGNTFSGADRFYGGAGLMLELSCPTDAVTLSHNQITNNTLDAISNDGLGAGLYIWGEANETIVQNDNTFSGNSVVASGTPEDYGGGGEWAQRLNVQSTGDSFNGNSLPGTTGSNWSWGGGFASVNCDYGTLSASTSTFSDDVVAANTITNSASDLSADAQGAGVYLGCSVDPDYNGLTINDSTITDNKVVPSASDAVAGIDGAGNDTLTLNNTIVYGDSGGSEVSGFTASGSSLTASYSDLCNGSSPYTGTGNICANPQLGGTDGVQESASSPTLNAGSNALIPSGLTSDFFGNPRTNAPTATCSVNTNVDIGAAQYGPVCKTVPAPPPPVTLALTGVSQSHTKWRAGSAQATIARRHKHHKPRAPLGTTFSLTINTQATVTLAFTRLSGGRMVGGRCVKPKRRNHRKPACQTQHSSGGLTFPNEPAGARTITFDGVLQNGRKLRAGAYTVAITAATSTATVPAQTLRFTIVR
jgi:hypothetical protein